jgi:hypothetical protein
LLFQRVDLLAQLALFKRFQKGGGKRADAVHLTRPHGRSAKGVDHPAEKADDVLYSLGGMFATFKNHSSFVAAVFALRAQQELHGPALASQDGIIQGRLADIHAPAALLKNELPEPGMTVHVVNDGLRGAAQLLGSQVNQPVAGIEGLEDLLDGIAKLSGHARPTVICII